MSVTVNQGQNTPTAQLTYSPTPCHPAIWMTSIWLYLQVWTIISCFGHLTDKTSHMDKAEQLKKTLGLCGFHGSKQKTWGRVKSFWKEEGKKSSDTAVICWKSKPGVMPHLRTQCCLTILTETVEPAPSSCRCTQNEIQDPVWLDNPELLGHFIN